MKAYLFSSPYGTRLPYLLGLFCCCLLLDRSAALAQDNLALQLDGQGAYAALPSGIFDGLEESTVELWAKWEELRHYSQLFAFGTIWQSMGVNHWENTPALQFFIYDHNRDLHLMASMNLYDHQNNQSFVRAEPHVGDLLTDRWHHVAAVAGKGGMKLYLDGVLVAQNEYEGSFAQIGSGVENFLGRSHWESNAYFKGYLDEVRVWNTARTPEQLRAHLYRRLRGTEKGLVGLWNFDGGDGRDRSPGANHASLVGKARCVPQALPDSAAHVRPVVLHGTVRGPAGEPVQGARVHLDKGGRVIGRTWTDPGGRYTLVVLADSGYGLAATYGEWGTWRSRVSLRPGTRLELNLHLRAAVSIAGQLTSWDRMQRHAYVWVEAESVDEPERVYRTFSDASGHYRFVNVKAGRYRVRLLVPGGPLYFGGAPQGRVLEVGDRPQPGIDLHLPPFKKGVWRQYTSLEGLAGNAVTSLAMGQEGALWVGTEGGLVRFDGDQFTRYGKAEGLPDVHVTSLAMGQEGALWVGTEGGLARFDGDQFTRYGKAEGLPDDRVRALYPGPGGLLWAGTEASLGGRPTSREGVWAGLARFEGTRFLAHPLADLLTMDNTILSIVGDGASGLWLGSRYGGLVHYDGSTFKKLATPEYMPDWINALYRDAAGVLWIGARDGLWRYDGRSWAKYLPEDGLVQEAVLALHGHADGALWIGTEGGLARYDSDALVNFSTEDGMLEDHIRALYLKRDGELLLGTASPGLVRYDGHRFVNITAQDGLPDDLVTAFYQDEQGDLWLGTQGWGLVHLGPQGLRRYTEKDGLIDNEIRALCGARGGGVWIGTVEGLSHFEDGHFRSYGQAEGLFDGQIEALYEDEEGILWLGTRSSGVVLYDGTSWASLDTRDGLAGNWVSAIGKHPDGHLFFGTDSGLTRYRRGSWPPRVRIVGVQADKPYAEGETFTAGHRITINLAAVDFKTVPEKRLYRCRLEGIDAEWRRPTHQAFFEWTPQGSGTYTFAVQAIDRDLNYSEPARRSLVVRPPWYLNPWISLPAGTGILALVAISAISSARYYVQRRRTEEALRRSHEDLERQVQERTRELEAEIAERRRAEVQLTASLEEKEILLKEIHHRVKNNLQVVSSMINLQASGVEEERIKQLFEDSRQRIQSMALIHEQLYQSVDLSSIDLEAYLSQLVRNLFYTYGLSHKGVTLDMQLEAIRVHIDTAIPCGLIVNELVSNALKHAFPGGRDGALKVVLRQEDGGGCELRVEDNGVGLPPELDFRRTSSLGLKLVTTLTQQIKGEMECISQAGEGTSFAMRWRVDRVTPV
jgi:two-component sensor histidine kinase/ligand-binding sensor domain-containing protein